MVPRMELRQSGTGQDHVGHKYSDALLFPAIAALGGTMVSAAIETIVKERAITQAVSDKSPAQFPAKSAVATAVAKPAVADPVAAIIVRAAPRRGDILQS